MQLLSMFRAQRSSSDAKNSHFADDGEWSIHHGCSRFLHDHFSVPEFASNDVLHILDLRLRAAAKTTASTKEHKPKLSALTTKWPTLWHEQNTGSCTHGPQQAPGGAHVLIIPLRGRGIKVRVYAPHHHHKFSRVVVSGGRRLYRGSPQDDDEKLEIELKYPDVLFVPSGSIYSWSCTSESILGEEQGKNTIPVVVMTHGFVDAGALSHFINELALDAAQDAEAYSPGILESVFSMYGGNVPFKQLAPSNARALPALLPWRNLKGIADSGYQDDTHGSEKRSPKKKYRKSAHREWRMRKLWSASFLHIPT